MQLGRAFTAGECKPGEPVAVVLSDLLGRTRPSGDRAVVGRSIRPAPTRPRSSASPPPVCSRSATARRCFGAMLARRHGRTEAGRPAATCLCSRPQTRRLPEAADKHMTVSPGSSSRNSRVQRPLERACRRWPRRWPAGEDVAVRDAGRGGVRAANRPCECGKPAAHTCRRGRELAVRMSPGHAMGLIRQLPRA
jgi:hypothetical protein